MRPVQPAMNARPTGLRLSWLVGGVLFAVGASVIALIVGPTAIDRSGVVVESIDRLFPLAIESNLTETQKSIVWNLRLPRVALGLLVGAALSTAGATYQGIFRNPLADPYLLGVAAGGGFGATLAFVNGWGDGLGALDGVQIGAFIGSMVAVTLTWILSASSDRTRSTTSLILAGVAVASFFTALQTFLQQRNADDIRAIYTWFLGGLTTSGWSETLQLLPVALVCVTMLALAGRTLDVLGVGDEEATMLGLPVLQVRVILAMVAGLLTASAVAVSGLIGFVGLIVPHTVRMLFGASYRVIVPLSILVGAGFLVLCDLGARTLLSPSEIPIGVVTAFLGAPFFLVILGRATVR